MLFAMAVPTYAADGSDTIDTADMTISGSYMAVGDNKWTDCTNELTTGVYHSAGTALNGMYSVRFPLSLNDGNILLFVSEPFSINANHEYNVNFDWGYTQSTKQAVYCMISLQYFSSNGELIKEQSIDGQLGTGNFKIHSFDIDFKPDVSDLSSGYKCKFVISFTQNSSTTASEVFCLSPQINLIDKDDDSGWFQKIINKIQETIDGIKQIPQKINEKLTELKESIVNAFVELKDNIIEGLKSLFVPDEGFFDDKKAEMEAFLEEHFGVIYTAPNMFITVLRKLLTISPGQPSITIPAISFDFLGETFYLFKEPISVNLYDFIAKGTPLYSIYQFYRACVTAILIYTFIDYAINKYNYLFGKDGEAVSS